MEKEENIDKTKKNEYKVIYTLVKLDQHFKK